MRAKQHPPVEYNSISASRTGSREPDERLNEAETHRDCAQYCVGIVGRRPAPELHENDDEGSSAQYQSQRHEKLMPLQCRKRKKKLIVLSRAHKRTTTYGKPQIFAAHAAPFPCRFEISR
jgi:hypothetical protein